MAGHLERDAATFADWGIDYLKVGAATSLPPHKMLFISNDNLNFSCVNFRNWHTPWACINILDLYSLYDIEVFARVAFCVQLKAREVRFRTSKCL